MRRWNPTLDKERQGWGTHCVYAASEVKSLGHPPGGGGGFSKRVVGIGIAQYTGCVAQRRNGAKCVLLVVARRARAKPRKRFVDQVTLRILGELSSGRIDFLYEVYPIVEVIKRRIARGKQYSFAFLRTLVFIP
jgi:hypothetical protein